VLDQRVADPELPLEPQLAELGPLREVVGDPVDVGGALGLGVAVGVAIQDPDLLGGPGRSGGTASGS
jgi:hypothetical protein